MLIITLLFASRAYLQQSPTCTRVQIIQLALVTDRDNISPYVMSIMLARGRGCVNGLNHSGPYVLCKSLMSPNLTLPHHLMTMSKYFVWYQSETLFPSVHNDPISQSNFHIVMNYRNTPRCKSNFLSQTLYQPLNKQSIQCRFYFDQIVSNTPF